MRCFGSTQSCCNYFDLTDSCVADCPGNSAPNANFTCECDAGYSPVGSVCVEDDGCESDPCENNATCHDLTNTFSCTCVAGFTGPTCGTDIEDCTFDPCKNGSTCTDLVDGFSCDCAAGFTGDTCETDIDDSAFESGSGSGSLVSCYIV